MNKNRRKFLIGTTVTAAGIGGGSYALVNFFTPSQPQVSETRLPIPELLDTSKGEVTVTAQSSQHEFYTGIKSHTMGFNGSYLGPTVKLYKNQRAAVTFRNELNEPTTIHGHGLHVAGRWDGGPQNVIAPGEHITYQFDIIQQAGTSWYHPHVMGRTAEQVHAGLAGLYIIEDENSASLNLPSIYGVNDIPLAVQDRTFINGVMRPYSITAEQLMEGLKEETLVVNGAIAPYQDVPKGWVRLRLLNGSNARYHRYRFADSSSFYKIATEGGLLEKPVQMIELVMGPGERNEIMLDMSQLESQQLLCDFIEGEGLSMFFKSTPQLVLELRANKQISAQGELPQRLNRITPYSLAEATVVRDFVLEMGMGGGDEGEGQSLNAHANHNMFSINGRSMDMAYINHTSKLGQLERWRIRGEEMRHPFHMHGTSFLILSQNGVAPAEADRGWKDTVDVNEGVTEVLLKFDVPADKQYPFMYHCHILEHEDSGMMGQFTVV